MAEVGLDLVGLDWPALVSDWVGFGNTKLYLTPLICKDRDYGRGHQLDPVCLTDRCN